VLSEALLVPTDTEAPFLSVVSSVVAGTGLRTRCVDSLEFPIQTKLDVFFVRIRRVWYEKRQ
jgi:hypothetical protein